MTTETLTQLPQRSTASRTAAWAGLVWFVASLGATSPESPDIADASADDIRTYIEQSQTTLGVNALSSVVGVISLLVLCSALARLVCEHRPDSVVPGYIVGTGALAAVQMLFFSTIYSVWVVTIADDLSDEAITSLFTAGLFADMFGSLCIVAVCAMIGAVSYVALRDRFLSRPVAALGLIIAAAELVSLLRLVSDSAPLEAAMYVGIFGWFLWPAIIGADLGIRRLRDRRAAANPGVGGSTV